MSAIDSEALLAQLSDLEFFQACHVRESVTTTFDWLKELDQANAPHGTIVIAEQQTAAKGRRGRGWESPKGGAWIGLLLRLDLDLSQISCLSIVTAVGVVKALNENFNLPAKIKWPNDVLLYDKKLCGILAELSNERDGTRALHMGIGVNVNNSVPRDARIGAIALADVLGYAVDLQAFCGIVLRSLAESYQTFLNEGFFPIKSAWETYSALGEKIWLHRNGNVIEADVLGISDVGRLIVKINNITEELIAEDVTLSLSED